MALTIQEISRKLLHLVALLMPLCIFYLPLFAPFILGFIFFVVLLMELVRFRFPVFQELFHRLFWVLLRREEAHLITGATWIILSSFLCSLLFWERPQIPFMALTMFILGDSAAAVVGLTVGKVRIGDKTLEGSGACFAVCLVLGYLVFPYLPRMDHRLLNPIIIWVGSLVITFFELIPIRVMHLKINDNLSVPLIASAIIYVLEGLIYI